MVNRFTIIEISINKRPDIILFVNGIPLVVIGLKNAADENATIDWTIKESVRAKIRVIVRRTLRQYGYPPDMEKHMKASFAGIQKFTEMEIVSLYPYVLCKDAAA